MFRARLLGFLCALLMVASVASAQAPPADLEVPQGAEQETFGNVTWFMWAGSLDEADETLEPGTDGTLFVAGFAEPGSNVTLANVSLSATTGLINWTDAFWQADFEGNESRAVFNSFPFSLGEDGNGDSARFVAEIEVYGPGPEEAEGENETANATVPADPVLILGAGEIDYEVQIGEAPAPVEPGLGLLPIAGGAAVLLVVGGGAFAVARQRQRARTRAPPRSSALRQEQQERRIERARSEQEREAVQAEIREEEVQRQEARELQILRAKKADVERMLELLRQRKESGQITELQYNKMTEKKRGELEAIEQEIRDFQAGNA